MVVVFERNCTDAVQRSVEIKEWQHTADFLTSCSSLSVISAVSGTVAIAETEWPSA